MPWWSKAGPRQMLVAGAKVLNDDWEGEFKKQYPLFRSQLGSAMPMTA